MAGGWVDVKVQWRDSNEESCYYMRCLCFMFVSVLRLLVIYSQCTLQDNDSFFFPSRSRECMNESRLRPIAARFLWKVCFCFHRHSMTLHKRAFKFYSPKHSLIDLGKRGYICPSEIANHSIWHTDAVLYCCFFLASC